jgi:hypothetical protein
MDFVYHDPNEDVAVADLMLDICYDAIFVLQIFDDNNFAEEYARRWPTEEAEFAPYYAAPLARHSTAAICEYLRGLRECIRRLSVDGVEEKIQELIAANRHSRAAFARGLRELMLNPGERPGWVAVAGDAEREVHTEIAMYVEAKSLAWTWFLLVHECRDPEFGQMGQDDALQDRWLAEETSAFAAHCLDALPVEEDLLFEGDGQFYKRSYAEYEPGRTEKTNRRAALLGVGLLRREMRWLQPLVRECLSGEHEAEKCTELDEHLRKSEEAFEAWEAAALRALVPAVREELRGMHETEKSVTLEHETWQEHLRTLADGEGKLLQKCTFCEESLRDVVYMPCKHFVSCQRCAMEWIMRSGSRKCPFCVQKAEIASVRAFTHGSTVVLHKQNARLGTCEIGSLLAELKRGI